MKPLLQLDRVSVSIPIDGDPRRVISDVSLDLAPGEALGVVGESGSGKSMTARTVMGLLPSGSSVAGAVRFDGTELYGPENQGRAGRSRTAAARRDIGMVFQDARAHLDPRQRIGDFLVETDRGGAARKAAVETLDRVGIDDAARRMRQYPHEMSGGMLQRVMIASVLLARPRLILADEPTTALDATTQAEVVSLLDELRREDGTALVFITHDLDLAATFCDRVAVIYAGCLQEVRQAELLIRAPLHPYTRGLLASRPATDSRVPRLPVVPGRPLSAFEAPPGCAFAARCAHAVDHCHQTRPALTARQGALVRCDRLAAIEAAPVPEKVNRP
ncbi:ABC transporter ATP-binding protein [Streptomyces albipurpureus]|uniref:ABC transporter ATP-binding protein n=1 Tax=Streptomyces albipurpureus TaxID=2897419 RepID=A0ABT0ULD4_9ACTN|nr:ABC transporter ATP-binding protein [Streptomyces sp. CWNU-1]MCM2389249.1 ABC transporter ATP-binding protein [Streptomyces sp. CWNU-1]